MNLIGLPNEWSKHTEKIFWWYGISSLLGKLLGIFCFSKQIYNKCFVFFPISKKKGISSRIQAYHLFDRNFCFVLFFVRFLSSFFCKLWSLPKCCFLFAQKLKKNKPKQVCCQLKLEVCSKFQILWQKEIHLEM